MKITYIGSFAAGVQLANGQWLAPNEPVEVDDATAGRAPKGNPGDDDYDPGEGLLAQTGNFATARTAARKADTTTTKET